MRTGRRATLATRSVRRTSEVPAREGRARRALRGLSRTRTSPRVGCAMLSLLVLMARAPSVRTGHHRTPTSRLADHAFSVSLVREGRVIAAMLAPDRTVSVLRVRRAPLGSSVLMERVHCVLRASSRTVPAVLATHVVLALLAPVALALCVWPDLSRMRCAPRARCAMRVSWAKLAFAPRVRQAHSRWATGRPANLARHCPTARICSARTARHAQSACQGMRWTQTTRAAQSATTVCTARTVRRAWRVLRASSRTTRRAA